MDWNTLLRNIPASNIETLEVFHPLWPLSGRLRDRPNPVLRSPRISSLSHNERQASCCLRAAEVGHGKDPTD